MLRLLIKDITVEKPAHQKQLLVHIRWQGGACSDISVQLPPNIADRVRYPSVVVDRIRELAHDLPDGEIADQLNRQGQLSAKGQPYTVKIIQWIQVAKRLGTSDQVVYYWIEHGIIRSRRINSGMPHWITLGDADEEKLQEWVRKSRRILPVCRR